MKKLMMVLALTGPLAVTAAEVSAPKKDESGQTAAVVLSKGIGIVKGLQPAMGRVIISHEPIPSLKWPSMVMSFRISAELARGLKDGQKVEFEFQPRDMDGTITRVTVLSR